MKRLYIDIGNNELKIYDMSGKLTRIKNTKDNKVIDNISDFLSVENYFIISSVDKNISNILEEYFLSNQIQYYFFTNKDYPIFFKDYNIDLSQLGEDRAINIIALKEQETEQKNIIIDFGTALTIDVVSSNRYETGYIYPGINILKDSLISKTSKLEDFQMTNIHNTPLITTESQINDAIILGCFGAINIFLKDINKHFNIDEYNLILTGGGFENVFSLIGEEKFTKLLNKDYKKIDNLNYLGLKIAYDKIEEGVQND